MNKTAKHFYEFGPFRADAGQRLLFRDGEVVPLTPKAFDLLLALVENSEKVVTKEQLLEIVWPDSFVEEANLSHNIYKLREALGERQNGSKYIDTIARRGYRFVAPVNEVREEESNPLPEEFTEPSTEKENRSSQPTLESTPQVIEKTATDIPTHATETGRSKIAMRVGAGALLIVVCGGLFMFLSGRFFGKTTRADAPLHSIAVLPFKPLAANNRDESLELGMADTLITRLSAVRQVSVRPISAVRKYSALEQDAIEAGRQLQVESVLEGSIQRDADRIRVTARLIRLSDGKTLWSGTFDEQYTNIFSVQDSISKRVSAEMLQELSPKENSLLTKRYTDDTEAYKLYLRGRYHWSTFKPEDLLASINYYHAALEKDPNYALAYSGLAGSYAVIGIYGPLPPEEAFPKAREAALNALRLDDSLSDAHVSMGAVKLISEWDWSGAAKELLRAQELDPNNASAHELYGYYLQAMGRADESVIEMQRALELDPSFIIVNDDLMLALFWDNRYDEAIKQAQHSLALDPNQSTARNTLGYIYAKQQRYEQATEEFDKAMKIQKSSYGRAGLGSVLAVTGRKAEALAIAEELKNNPTQTAASYLNIATVYAALGDTDQAFAFIEKAYERHYPKMWGIRLDKRFENLHSDSRFKDLLRRVGLSS